MMIKPFFRNLLIALLLIVNIGCDQVTKIKVREGMETMEQITVVKDILTLTKVENTGAFLSLGATWPNYLKAFLLIALPVVALLLMLVYLVKNKSLSNLSVVGWSFVVGGGIGNIYDRIVYGSVTDFLHLDFGIFQTGIFNMADVSVMVGMCLVIFGSLAVQHPEKRASL